MAVAERRGDGELAAFQVYEPHRVGLPPLGPYLRELWRRRAFAFELARTTLRAHCASLAPPCWMPAFSRT